MKGVFFIVGPTATGKSDLAADVALRVDAEIVSADAFQIYKGLDLLTAKPDAATLVMVPHHLIGVASLTEEMNAEKFRRCALEAIAAIQAHGKRVIVAGGSGMYVKALTHGLSKLPPAQRELREELNALETAELIKRLSELDPATAGTIDLKNRRRVVRALEICLLTGQSAAAQRMSWQAQASVSPTSGVFLWRDREELYARIDQRVGTMFNQGVVEEVRKVTEVGATADGMLGLHEIRALIEGSISRPECIVSIQQATRRYAKRQLTWFRRQTNFESLNLSPLNHDAAVEWITQRALVSFASRDDRNAA
jgi:tRNA dimethylallyltransferase